MEVERTNVAQDYWELTRPFTLLAPFIALHVIAGWTGQER